MTTTSSKENLISLNSLCLSIRGKSHSFYSESTNDDREDAGIASPNCEFSSNVKAKQPLISYQTPNGQNGHGSTTKLVKVSILGNNNTSAVKQTPVTKNGKAPIDETKFKTEMCKNWSETGRCNYGSKCKFAHGRTELQDKSIPNKNRYKSRPCTSYHNAHFCSYGTRCLFAHRTTTLEEINSRYYYSKYINFPSLDDYNPKNARRLPFFAKLQEEISTTPDMAEKENTKKVASVKEDSTSTNDDMGRSAEESFDDDEETFTIFSNFAVGSEGFVLSPIKFWETITMALDEQE